MNSPRLFTPHHSSVITHHAAILKEEQCRGLCVNPGRADAQGSRREVRERGVDGAGEQGAGPRRRGRGHGLHEGRAGPPGLQVEGARAVGPGCAGGVRGIRSAGDFDGRGERGDGQDRPAVQAAAGLAQPAHADAGLQREADPAVPGAVRAGRDEISDSDFRAGRGRRSGGDEDARGERTRRLAHQRPQDLDQRRGPGGFRHPHGGDGSGEGRARRNLRLHRGQGHAGLQRAAQDPDDRRPQYVRGRAGGLLVASDPAPGRGGQGFRADAIAPFNPPRADRRLVRGPRAARAGHDGRLCPAT